MKHIKEWAPVVIICIALMAISIWAANYCNVIIEDQYGDECSSGKLCPVGRAALQGEKYALIVVGSTRGEKDKDLSDPIDAGQFTINSIRSYDAIKDLGFKPENIRYLHPQLPDFDDPLEARKIKALKDEQFTGAYDNKSTTDNILKEIRRMSKIVTKNDTFILLIMSHGNPDMIEIQADGMFGAMEVVEVQTALNYVNPGHGLFFLDTCHSGAFIKQLKLPDFTMISATGEHTYGWGDRFFSGDSYFFKALSNPEADTNVDFKITVKEAFDFAEKESLEHMKRIHNYLKTKYKGDYSSLEDEVSVVPNIIVGNKSSGDYPVTDLRR